MFNTLLLAAGLALGQTTLDSHVLSEQGGLSEAGSVQLLSAGGQTLAGQAAQDASVLDLGFLNTLPLLTKPAASITSPGGQGVCGLVNGQVPVSGQVESTALAFWRLEHAQGALISSGTTETSGVLGVWDTAGLLSGLHTLRLTAVDLFGGSMMSTLEVFVGQPAEALTVGGFNKPEAAAAATSGRLLVADRNNDRVLILSSTGGALGRLEGFNKPSGVVADGAGAIYVSDTNNDRVLKLGPDGSVLLTLGAQGKKKDQLGKPAGLALDLSGRLYVADGVSRSVKVFRADGALHRSIALPAGGKPSGVAVDAAGRIYVADEEAGRLLVYDSEGGLLRTLGAGLLEAPGGVAVDAAGDCLLASSVDRVLRFDRFGRAQASFLGLQKPAGLGLTAAGELLVADRNNDRLVKLALPGAPPLTADAGEKPRGGRAKRNLEREKGGTVERDDKAGVVVPAFALDRDLEITVSSPTADGLLEARDRKGRMQEKKLKGLSEPVEFGPEGTRFGAAVTLVLPYDAALARDYGVAEQALRVHYWNPATKEWEPLDSTVDPVARTVSARTDHFSLYQVLGPEPVPNAVAEEFALREVYSFPNPARPGQRPTIRVQVGAADSVEVNIYDVSGRRVEHVRGAGPKTVDDGQGPELTHDFAWDTSGVGSGVYVYAVTAKKAGRSDIRKLGKVAVIK